MIIDAHNHVLAAGLYPGYERFIKEMTMGYFQSHGSLPEDRDPKDDEAVASLARDGLVSIEDDMVTLP